MNIKKITPRGYCYGVVDSLVIVSDSINNPDIAKPIYILGEIVHNEFITEALKKNDIISLDSKGKLRVDLLDEVQKDATVIFTAHGVSPQVYERADELGLKYIDATCPEVKKTHDLIKSKISEGYQFLYIGKKFHPEPESCIQIDPENIFLAESIDDLNSIKFNTDKIMITNQTTMSLWDVIKISEKAKEIWSTAVLVDEICDATSQRQMAVVEQAKDCDLLIVVGSKKSNNSNRLKQVSEEMINVKSVLISSLADLDESILIGKNLVGVTAGASTPAIIFKDVINYIDKFDENNKETWDKSEYKVNVDRILIQKRIKNDTI